MHFLFGHIDCASSVHPINRSFFFPFSNVSDTKSLKLADHIGLCLLFLCVLQHRVRDRYQITRFPFPREIKQIIALSHYLHLLNVIFVCSIWFAVVYSIKHYNYYYSITCPNLGTFSLFFSSSSEDNHCL